MIGARRKVSDHVMAGVALLIQKGIAAGAAGQRVVARPADQYIVAAATDQGVVAQAAVEQVGIAVAGQGVVVVSTDQVLDRHQGVGARATGILSTGSIEVDRHGAGGTAITGGVDTCATVEQVIAGTTDQLVIAVTTVKEVVAIPTDQDVITGTGIEGVITGACQQGIVAAGTGEGVALLIRDVDIASAAAAMPVAEGIGAVVGLVLRVGIVDCHGQRIVFSVVDVAARRVGQVDQVNAVDTIMTGGKGVSVSDGLIAAVLILPLHQDVARRPVVIQLEGLTFFQGDRQHVLVVGIVRGHVAQVAVDDQRGSHGVGRASESAARQVPELVGSRVAGTAEVDLRRCCAAHREAGAFGCPAGFEGGRRSHTESVIVGIAVIGQQCRGRYHDAAGEDVADDVIGARYRRGVGVDLHHQVGAAQVAVVVAGSETDVFRPGAASVLRRCVGKFTGIHVDQQGATEHGLDVEGVGHRIEAATVGSTGGIAALAIIGLGIVSVGGAVDQQRLDEAAVGAEDSATQQAAGDRRTLHCAGQHRVELAEVGDHGSIGVGVGTAIVGQWIEVFGIDAAAQANGIGFDAIVVEESLPGGFPRRGNGMPRSRSTVGEEVHDVLRPGYLATGGVGRLRRIDRRVVIGRAVRAQAVDDCLGLVDGHPDCRLLVGTAGEGHQLHLHIAHLVVLVEQCVDRLLGQLQAGQPRYAGSFVHTAGHVDDQQQVGIHLPRRHRTFGPDHAWHVVNDVHIKGGIG
ncbi:hypothetical protein PSWA111526_07090 [Pseudomonas wadenswilerensis]